MQALAAVPDNDPDVKKKTVLLLDCYVQSERFTDAKRIVDGHAVNAAEFYYLSGKTFYYFGNYQKAAALFETALQKSCLMWERNLLIDEALYYTALASVKKYEEDRSTENLDAARSAWQAVKERFSKNPNDSRFRQAIEVLSRL